MTWEQTLVTTWLQFSLTSALLLAATRLALRWLPQPVDRIRAIQIAIGAAVLVPLWLLSVPGPIWQLEVIPQTTTAPESPGPAIQTAPLSDQGDAANRHTELDRSLLSDADRFQGVEHASPQSSPERLSAGATSRSARQPTGTARYWRLAAATLLGLHAVAILFFLVERGVGAFRLRQICCAANAAGPVVMTSWDAITNTQAKNVRLLVSAEIDAPFTFGWRQPVVVIPQALAHANGSALRFCLTHEWSHIERRDMLTWHGMWFGQLLLWSQPFFWGLRRELRLCQDMLADHAATRAADDALEYSELLVLLALQQRPFSSAGALTLLDHPSQLTRRVKQLLE